ncbi:MAG: lepB [Candidatus Eremiobacteraeota bacterium]|nr:lepB [Candidatus Eremiobacteraeota bacterium]
MKRGWPVAVVCAVALVIGTALGYGLLRFRHYSVPSGAMEPTIPARAVLFVDRFAYHGHTPDRGDVILFMPPILANGAFIKRVVAVPGDRFAIRHGHMTLNGKPVDEPYVKEATDYEFVIESHGIRVNGMKLDPAVAAIPPRSEWSAPDTVPRGCYVALGDNRNNSEDSHIWGFLCPGRASAYTSQPPALVGRAVLPPFASM